MDEFYQEIDRLFQAGETEVAGAYMEEYLARLDADPSSPLASKIAVLNELGGWYRGVHRFSQSELSYKRALELLGTQGGSRSAAFARILLNLAGTYRMAGDQEGAIQAFGQAGDIFSSPEVEDPYGYVSVLNNLSHAYHEKGDLPRALSLAQEALEGLEGCPDAGPFEYATSHVNIATILLAAEDRDRAEKELDQALRLFDEMEGETSHRAAALVVRGTLRYQEGRYQEAAQDFRDSMRIVDHFFGHNADYASGATGLALCLEAMGERDAARDAQQQAVEALEGVFGPEHPRTLEARAGLESL